MGYYLFYISCQFLSIIWIVKFYNWLKIDYGGGSRIDFLRCDEKSHALLMSASLVVLGNGMTMFRALGMIPRDSVATFHGYVHFTALFVIFVAIKVIYEYVSRGSTEIFTHLGSFHGQMGTIGIGSIVIAHLIGFKLCCIQDSLAKDIYRMFHKFFAMLGFYVGMGNAFIGMMELKIMFLRKDPDADIEDDVLTKLNQVQFIALAYGLLILLLTSNIFFAAKNRTRESSYYEASIYEYSC